MAQSARRSQVRRSVHSYEPTWFNLVSSGCVLDGSRSSYGSELLIFVPSMAHSYDCSDTSTRKHHGFGEIADLPLRHRPVHRRWQLGAYVVSQAVELGT